jgi:hypothetical protein
MRSILVFAMAMLGGLSAAWAQPADRAGDTPAAVEQPAAVEPAAVEQPAAAEPAAADDTALLTPDTAMPAPEPLLQKPSGFWSSGRPAVGGAYRYRLLAIGTGVLLATVGFTVWIVRRYPRRNA